MTRNPNCLVRFLWIWVSKILAVICEPRIWVSTKFEKNMMRRCKTWLSNRKQKEKGGGESEKPMDESMDCTNSKANMVWFMPCVSGPGSSSLPFQERFLFGDTRARGGAGCGHCCWAGTRSLCTGPRIAMLACGHEALWGQRDKGHWAQGMVVVVGRRVGGAVPAAWGVEATAKARGWAGESGVGGRYLAQRGLPHRDSRAGSLRTFLCHLY